MNANGHSVLIRSSEERRRAMKLKARRKAFKLPAERTRGRPRVADLLRLVVEDYELHGKANIGTVTQHAFLLTEAVGRMKAKDVNYQTGLNLAQRWRRHGRAPATINRIFSVLRQGFRLGEMSGLVDRVPRLPMLREDNVRQGFVEPEDFQRILDALDNDDVRDLVEWLGVTGMRVGEARALKWQYVHPVNGSGLELRIPARVTKNRQDRVLPIVGPLKVVIDRRRKGYRKDVPWIFRWSTWLDHGDMPIKDFDGRWKRTVREIGKPDLMIHDLRRSAVRNLRLAGISEEIAMKISGHRSRAVFRRYNIVTNDDVAEALRGLPGPQPPW